MTFSESDVFRPPPPRRLFSYDWAAGSVSPFVPSEAAAVEAALRAACVTREDVLLDLGAGVTLGGLARRGTSFGFGAVWSSECDLVTWRSARDL